MIPEFNTTGTLTFLGGESIRVTVLDPSRQSRLEALKEWATYERRDFAATFGEDATTSNYAMYSKIVTLTPGDVNPSLSKDRILGYSALLVSKKGEAPFFASGLYSFKTEWVRGYQEGDSLETDEIVIDAYDARDREVRVSVYAGPRLVSWPTQADINRIIFSLRPASASDGK